ncbi:MAG: hypothetical protein IT452_17860 [Planctomycetia bacterium]|nr:hypothetical protein [Planctomycetia bacterium]
MKQITLRDLDESTSRAVRDLAAREGISLNKAVLRLLKSATASRERPGKRIGAALDRYFGQWTRAEAAAFRKAVAVFEQIDPEQWK